METIAERYVRMFADHAPFDAVNTHNARSRLRMALDDMLLRELRELAAELELTGPMRTKAQTRARIVPAIEERARRMRDRPRTEPSPGERVEGVRIIARVQLNGAPAETVQHVQEAWRRIFRGAEIEWIRVTIAGRQDDGSFSWQLTLPPELPTPRPVTERFTHWSTLGDRIAETGDSWQWRAEQMGAKK